MEIGFTQYLRPNGRTRIVTTDVADDLAKDVEAIETAGYRLTAEVLSTGVVSLCIEGQDGDVGGELVPNGAGVPAAVDTLIRGFATDRNRGD